MDWIETKPPIAYADVDHLIEAIDSSVHTLFDFPRKIASLDPNYD